MTTEGQQRGDASIPSGNTHASSRSPLWPPAEFVAVSGLSLLMRTSIITQDHMAFLPAALRGILLAALRQNGVNFPYASRSYPLLPAIANVPPPASTGAATWSGRAR